MTDPTPHDLTTLLLASACFQPERVVYSAWTGHLPFAHFVMRAKAPQLFVELGTHNANSYFAFCQTVNSCAMPTRCFAVDTWEGDVHAGAYDSDIFTAVASHNQAHYADFSTLLRETFDDALHRFEDHSIDLLHIDGLHTYEAVQHDFETWLPKLAPGAVVLFHDTQVRDKDFGVWRFWQELQARYPQHFEMQHSFGLGVLMLPRVGPSSTITFTSSTSSTPPHLATPAKSPTTAEADAADAAEAEEAANSAGAVAGVAGTTKDTKETKATEALAFLNLKSEDQAPFSLYFQELGQVQQERFDKVLTDQHVNNLTDLGEHLQRTVQALQQAQAQLLTEHEALQINLRDAQQILQDTQNRHDLETHALRLHIAVMENSRSWRLTAPMRDWGRVIKRRLSWVLNARRAILQKGGYKAIAQKGLHVLDQEGLPTLMYKSFQLLKGQGAGRGHAGAPSNDYTTWAQTFDTLTTSQREWIRAQHKTWENWPVISLLMPTYNTPPEYLTLAIESVRRQLYPKWELCIADDASPNPEVRQLLKDFEALDTRIRVVYRQTNGHICEASNSALDLVRTDWVALMDHDDELPVNALYEVAKTIVANPHAKMLYSDEDKIDGQGRRFDPHFKSDWNPELFFAQNYISHLGVYQTQMLKTIGGFRPGLEGSQDHDLLLRCLPHLEPTSHSIVHIPKILYHWRAIPGSTAMSPSAKDYTNRARLQALNDYFAGLGVKALVQNGLLDNTAKVDYPLPSPQPLVSLLIPTKDRLDLLKTCVDSILQKTTYSSFEIIILDNASVEPKTLAYFADIPHQDPRVRIVRDARPFNFSAINNLGVSQAKGAMIGLINNDIEVISPEWLTEMVRLAMQSDIGCVGAKLYYPSNKIQHAGVVLGILGVAGHSHKLASRHDDGYFGRLKLPQAMSAVTAACLLVRREVYDEVQGLDEENLKVAFNDVDFCLKVRSAGYRNVWTPYAELYHHESVSRGLEDTPEKKARFEKEVLFMKSKWGETLLRDPYYNPNLTLEHEDFSLSWNQP